jgi:ribonuclease P protein component
MAGGPQARLPLGRRMRLKQSRDFARVRRQGRRMPCGCFIANWHTLPSGSAMRLGVITAKSLGNAVIRARARRLLRETFRLHQHDFAQPVELVLVAQKQILGRGLADVEAAFLAMLRKAGLTKTQSQ